MTHASRAVCDGVQLIGHRLLDRYRVEERIARGGMSTVYRGWDERLLRPVCIKLFRYVKGAEDCRAIVHRQFVREAYTLSQLNHPHTLRIYDFGQTPEATGTPFQVSELAEGGTLRDLVRREGPLAIERALALLEPVAAALAEAHGMGIVHRDIKPSNVLLCRAGQETVVKLADFGIASSPIRGPEPARLLDSADDEEPVMYSLNWAAPEQLRREPVSPATDVYSLALLAAYVMTGRIVFGGDNVEALFKERREGDAQVTARLHALGLPHALTRALLAACRDQPGERIASAEAFMQALRLAWEDELGEHTQTAQEGATAPHDFSLPGHEQVEARDVTIDAAVEDEFWLGRRHVRVMPLVDTVDVDWPALDRTVRLRASALQIGGGIHLKGLDCFLSKGRGRPSSGISIMDGDATLGLVCAGCQNVGTVRVLLGTAGDAGQAFAMGDRTLRIPYAVASWAVVLAGGDDEPIVILLRAGG